MLPWRLTGEKVAEASPRRRHVSLRALSSPGSTSPPGRKPGVPHLASPQTVGRALSDE